MSTIRGRMILCYTALLIAVIIIFSIIYYNYTASLLIDRSSESMQQLAVNVNENLNAMFENMDSTANRIISSSLIKQTFYEAQNDADTLELMENKREMMELLFNVTGSKLNDRINLISISGKFVEFGHVFDLSFLPYDVLETAPWIEQCLALEGKMFIPPPHAYSWDNSNEIVISVCRALNSSFGAEYDAIVEVFTKYETFQKIVETVSHPTEAVIHLYDAQGTLIYPLETQNIDYYSLIDDPDISGTFTIQTDHTEEIAAYTSSSYTGITVVLTEPMNCLLQPVKLFRNWLLALGTAITIFTAILTSAFASQLTKPIRNIRHSISQLELTELHSDELAEEFTGPPHPVYELTNLNTAYVNMVNRLKTSLDETVSAQARETEARMLAMQAQINPHFLYNTITVISIRAEDAGNDEVVSMCESLSSMLRYIAREKPYTVSLGEELHHLQEYLYLMKCRYPDRFESTIHCPEELMSLPIPRLTIQPLIENCFKHGFSTTAPWTIETFISSTGDDWKISVTDNGSGFSEEALLQIEHFITCKTDPPVSESGSHIGLKNIYRRLCYYYDDRALFHVTNHSPQGCTVTIGGSIKPKRGFSHEF